jgi:hypothetical protein
VCSCVLLGQNVGGIDSGRPSADDGDSEVPHEAPQIF